MSDEGMPLETQTALYETRWGEVLDGLRKALADPVYVRHIHDLGLKRLKSGYSLYGDEMYHWHPAIREVNQDEELADYIVYGTSA